MNIHSAFNSFKGQDIFHVRAAALPKHTPDFLFQIPFVSPFLIPFQNPCSVTQCWSWSISLCPSSSRMCRGLSNGMCCPLTTIWLDCTVSPLKSLFHCSFRHTPYLMNFSIRVSLRDTDCSNCLRRFSAVTARFL